MLDHISIEVSNYATAIQFYKNALAPLGYKLLMEVHGFAGFGIESANGPLAQFWLHQSDNPTGKIHIAFTAANRKMVQAFYDAALLAGGKDNGAPGIREIYHPNYYGAFVLDTNGHNIEAVCHHSE